MYIGELPSQEQEEQRRRYPLPEQPPDFLSFAIKIPGVHRGSICNIFFYIVISYSSSRFYSCVGLLHVYRMITSTLYLDMVQAWWIVRLRRLDGTG